MSLASKFKSSGKNLEIILDGDIDEVSVFPEIANIPEGDLAIDLEGIRNINSVGCRQWGVWISQKAKAQGQVYLVKCSPAFITQLHVLFGFLPEHVKIRSFFIPYFCDSCRQTKFELATFGVDYSETQALRLKEEFSCSNCDGLMTLDVISDRYFKFLPAGLKKN